MARRSDGLALSGHGEKFIMQWQDGGWWLDRGSLVTQLVQEQGGRVDGERGDPFGGGQVSVPDRQHQGQRAEVPRRGERAAQERLSDFQTAGAQKS